MEVVAPRLYLWHLEHICKHPSSFPTPLLHYNVGASHTISTKVVCPKDPNYVPDILLFKLKNICDLWSFNTVFEFDLNCWEKTWQWSSQLLQLWVNTLVSLFKDWIMWMPKKFGCKTLLKKAKQTDLSESMRIVDEGAILWSCNWKK